MPRSPIDPRAYLPSRADAEQRQLRKELEKEHSVGLTEVAVLGLIGLTLAWDIGKQVEKCEAKKDRAEAEQRRRREAAESRSGSSRQGRERSRDYNHDHDHDHGRDAVAVRRRSVDPNYNNRHRADSARGDRYRDRIPPPPPPLYDVEVGRRLSRMYYYDIPERFEPEGRSRSRRDSW